MYNRSTVSLINKKLISLIILQYRIGCAAVTKQPSSSDHTDIVPSPKFSPVPLSAKVVPSKGHGSTLNSLSSGTAVPPGHRASTVDQAS